MVLLLKITLYWWVLRGKNSVNFAFFFPLDSGLTILQCQTFATCIGLTWAHDKSIICAKNALSCACNLSIWVVCHTFNQRSFLSHLHNIFIGFHGAHMTKKKIALISTSLAFCESHFLLNYSWPNAWPSTIFWVNLKCFVGMRNILGQVLQHRFDSSPS